MIEDGKKKRGLEEKTVRSPAKGLSISEEREREQASEQGDKKKSSGERPQSRSRPKAMKEKD